MSSDGEEAADEVCANCGKSAVDDTKLKICTACKLVKYCSVECQKNHRPQHKKACKKRAAEIRDDELFTQPDGNHTGECPICCLPLPSDESKSKLTSCCSKYICIGCSFANKLREFEQRLEQRCLYCREPLPTTDEEINQNHMKRIKANDPDALRQMGRKCHMEGDLERAFEYWTKAAELGNAAAHIHLSCMYGEGEGFVEKDMKKAVYHWEEAAISGHHEARWNLGILEGRKGRIDRAMKHYIIAANLGNDNALEKVKVGFAAGLFVSKEEYEAALRGHQAAVNATKSKQREEAYAFDNSSLEDQRRWVQSDTK
jgi:TPR repeat protein